MSAMPSLAIFVLYHMLQVATIAIKGTPAAPHDIVLHLSRNLADFWANVGVQMIVSGWLAKTLSLRYPHKKKSGGLIK